MAQKGKAIGNMKIGVTLDGTQMGSTLNDINKWIKVSESAMKANLKTLGDAGKSYEGLRVKVSSLEPILEGQAKKVDLLTDRYKKEVSANGEASEAAVKLATQINNAQAKYATYEKQLSNTKKELVYASTGVNSLTDEMKENERVTSSESKALKSAGDATGAFETKQSGLKKQVELSKRAVQEQQKVVRLMANEFGDSAKETDDARQALNKLERQSKLSERELQSFSQVGNKAGDEVEQFGRKAEQAGEKTNRVSGLFKGLKSAMGFGAVAGLASSAVSMVTNSIGGLLGEATDASDALDKFTQTMQFAGIDDSKIKKSKAEMKDYADKTVYELGDVMNTTAQLASNGVKDFDGLTQAIGNVNAVSGGNADTFKSVAMAMTQTVGAGKLTTENFNQISDAIPGASGKIQSALKEMGAYTNGDFRTAMANGEISADELNKAFMKLGMTDTAKKASSSTKTIEGAVGNLKAQAIDSINGIIDALGKGNITSVINGVTSEIGKFTKVITPGVKEAADAIKPLYTNFKAVLGLFSGDTKAQSKGLIFVRNIFPAEQAQEVIETITTVKKTIGALFEGLKNKDGSILYKLGLSPETITQVQTFIGQLKIYFKGFTDNLSNMFTVAVTIGKGIFQSLAPYIGPILVKVGSILSSIGQSMTQFWNENGKQIIQAIKNFFVFIQPVLKVVMSMVMGFIDNIGGLIKGVLNVIQGAIKIFTGLFTGDFSKMWEGIKQLFSGAIQALWNFVQVMFIARLLKGVKGFAAGFKTAVKDLWTKVSETFTQSIGNVLKSVSDWIVHSLGKVGGLKTSFVNAIKSLWTTVKTSFSGGISNTWGAVKQWASNLIGHVGSLRANLINAIKGLWGSIKAAFSDGISNVLSRMRALPGQIADGIRKGVGAVKGAFESIFKSAMDAVKKPVNLIIDGASWVLEKLGADKIKHWNPQYAKGTSTGGHPGGIMTVNDGAGAEMVVRPNGQAFIPQGKNITMYGEPGTQVIRAADTARLMGKPRSTFAYAKGTTGAGGFFSNMWSNVKDFGSSVLDKAKGAIGDVMDYVDDPSKLVSKLLGSELLGGLTHYPLEVGKGILTKAKAALVTKVKGLFDSMNSGSFDGALNANGVYQYLVDVAQKVMAKFPGMTVTSGYRPGDQYDHGKHAAIDIAYPSSMNGSSKYFDPANYAFDHFKKQVAYVITQNKVRDRKGTSGTGVHDGWGTWTDGDHYDHLHISGMFHEGDIFKAGSGEGVGAPSGVGVERWRSFVKRALGMVGLPKTAPYINAWLSQIATESNGNERAVGGNDGLNEGNATGLLQTKPGTFAQYAYPGHSNIFNGFDNMLSAMRYAMARYGSDMLGVIGHGHGYSNGGFVSDEQYRVAERGLPEVIIPLANSKRTRAVQLLNQTRKYLGVSEEKATNIVFSSDSEDTKKMIDLLIQQNTLLNKLLTKTGNVYLGKDKVGSIMDEAQGNNFAKVQYLAGNRG